MRHNKYSDTLRIFAQSSQPLFRLFCIPYAGGSASSFQAWPRGFPPGIQIHAVQLPGREERFMETPLRDMSALVKQLTAELSSFLNLPFAIFGHSVGALIGFELARQFRRERLPQPLQLVVSGLRAPDLISKLPPMAEMSERDLLQWLRQMNGAPHELLTDKGNIGAFLPILRADLTLATSYIYQEESPMQYGLSVYGGVRDVESNRAALLGWQKQTIGKFRLRMFPGGHFFIDTSQTVVLQAILADVTEALSES